MSEEPIVKLDFGKAAWRNAIINVDMAQALCGNIKHISRKMNMPERHALVFLVVGMETEPGGEGMTTDEITERAQEYLIKAGCKINEEGNLVRNT